MKIGLNTYSFRNELEKQKSLTLEQVFKIAQKIKLIQGIELLDRHIIGWLTGDLKSGVAQSVSLAKSYGFPIYALGPHLKVYQVNEVDRTKEVQNFKYWIDLAADNGIPQIRTQVSGPFGIIGRLRLKQGVGIAQKLLDQVLPYAETRQVKIGIETHWGYSSWPPFLQKITDYYSNHPSLGIIFDWGNFWNNTVRYGALEIAVQPHNHVHNHVKIFHFGTNFQEIAYDSYRIVQEFAKNNYQNYFSIEFEGKQPTLEGVYKSVHALQYAILKGQYSVNTTFDYSSLLK